LASARITHTVGILGLFRTVLTTGKLELSILALNGLSLILCEEYVIGANGSELGNIEC
jgi:hypothetical protein